MAWGCRGVMPLLFLEEYLDTIVALPHEVQRSLSLIKEQDALQQTAQSEVNSGIDRLLNENDRLSSEEALEILESIREGFMKGISHAEERVALAEHIHQTVKGQIVKLEDDLKHFEEEVRLAKMAEANKTIVHFPEAATRNGEDVVAAAEDNLEEEEEMGGREDGRPRRRTKTKDEINDVLGKKRSRTCADGPVHTIAAAVGGSEGSGAEQVYCYCRQPAFGEMIGCDGNGECDIEWFHYPCVGLERPPKDQWFCQECSLRMARDPLAVGGGGKEEEKAGKKPRPTFVK